MTSDTNTNTDTDTDTDTDNLIPKHVWSQLQSGAFNSLINHLQERSDEVQNIDLMSISGFCRNCLAKWLVLEARKLADEFRENQNYEHAKDIVKALDALDYDAAALEVYGCAYGDWKKRYAKKASDEQMQRYQGSSNIHAKHDKEMLKARRKNNALEKENVPSAINLVCQKPSLLSNVCCEDIDQGKPLTQTTTSSQYSNIKKSTFEVPAPPSNLVELRVGILTVSDRAAANEYTSGDLSGPAVESSLFTVLQQLETQHHININANIIQKKIVSDEIDSVVASLRLWSGKEGHSDIDKKTRCNLIFTTGGTGFASRDITPEATLSILDRECKSFMLWVSNECSKHQPLASLSRGTAGICGQSLIVNLPGNPAGAAEIVHLITPLLLHAVNDFE